MWQTIIILILIGCAMGFFVAPIISIISGTTFAVIALGIGKFFRILFFSKEPVNEITVNDEYAQLHNETAKSFSENVMLSLMIIYGYYVLNVLHWTLVAKIVFAINAIYVLFVVGVMLFTGIPQYINAIKAWFTDEYERKDGIGLLVLVGFTQVCSAVISLGTLFFIYVFFFKNGFLI